VWLVFDMCITVLIMVAVGEAITRSVSDQKYFNYRTEGLRAIRSVRQMLVGTMLIVCLFPFAASLTARTTNDTIARIITSEAMRNLRSRR
jgi:ABC-type polysaccharide/polyol phosphate export permease